LNTWNSECISPVTEETVLEITDFANEKEISDLKKLWDAQIKNLAGNRDKNTYILLLFLSESFNTGNGSVFER
jgi:hypothetical protein